MLSQSQWWINAVWPHGKFRGRERGVPPADEVPHSMGYGGLSSSLRQRPSPSASTVRKAYPDRHINPASLANVPHAPPPIPNAGISASFAPTWTIAPNATSPRS